MAESVPKDRWRWKRRREPLQRGLAAVRDVMVSVVLHDEAFDVPQLAMQVVDALLALQELAVVLLLLVLLQHLCAQFLQCQRGACC